MRYFLLLFILFFQFYRTAAQYIPERSVLSVVEDTVQNLEQEAIQLNDKLDSIESNLQDKGFHTPGVSEEISRHREEINLTPDLPSEKIDPEVLEDFNKIGDVYENSNSFISEASLDSSSIPASENIDSRFEDIATNHESINELGHQQNEALNQQQSLIDQQEEYKEQLEAFKTKEKVKDKFRNRLKEELVNSLANHQEIIQSAQKQVNKVKRNPYYKIGEVERGSGNRKFSNDKPFVERFHIGGNFQINNWKPFSVNLAPQISYQFLPKWRLGIGATYLFEEGKPSGTFNIPISQTRHGYKSFVEWDGFKGIVFHGEYELINEIEEGPNTEIQKDMWKHYALAGIGKRFKYSSFLKGSFLILYNFNHRKGVSYESPLVFRFGAEIGTNFLNNKSK